MNRKHNILLTLLFVLFFLNLFDGLYTYYVITNNLSYEKNPLMNVLLEYNPDFFLMFKILTMSGVVSYLWKNRDEHITASLIAVSVCTTFYSFLVLFQLITIPLFFLLP